MDEILDIAKEAGYNRETIENKLCDYVNSTRDIMMFVNINKDDIYIDADETIACGDMFSTVAYSVGCEFDVAAFCEHSWK